MSSTTTLAVVQSLLAALAVLILFGTVVGGLAWSAVRLRRRSGGGSLMQPFDEIWHPAAHRARLDVESQQEQPAPSPQPGDRLI